jgi:catechol 2,3-dioxygenase-like lactoylglutathione lyase family enzyme
LGTFFGEAKKVPRLSGETDKDHSQHRRWPNVSAVASANPARNFSPPFNVGRTNSLDYAEVPDFRPLHYAFLVSEAVFDTALARIRQAGIAFHADFRQQRPGEINTLYGGRGVFFEDPNGHELELITRPYGPVP